MVDATVNSTAALLDTAIPEDEPAGPNVRLPLHAKPAASLSPIGYFPDQIKHAYNFDQLPCTSLNTCGQGQTIAIIDAYDNSNVEKDLAIFSKEFGLPIMPNCESKRDVGCFQKLYVSGKKPLFDELWALEISLDVQWAHAIAPGAKILLVESQDATIGSLMKAVDKAISKGADQISMSWGTAEFPEELTYDHHFHKKNILFFASSGDGGAGSQYPSSSPNVVSVGGTTLTLDYDGSVLSEVAWAASGGGTSLFEKVPNYQKQFGVNANGMRSIPDVSYHADPENGFPVYDSSGYFGDFGWFIVGGTSAGPPQWAALAAIANSDSNSLIHNNKVFYKAALGSRYAVNYKDIVSGSNGSYIAGPGYDRVTGLGTPVANNLVQFLRTN